MEKLMIIILFSVMLFSCRTTKQVEHTVRETESVRVTYKDTTVMVPRAVATASLDSILSQFTIPKYPGETRRDTVRVITGDRAELQFYIDQYGKLQAQCTSYEQAIDLLQKTTEKIRTREVSTVEKRTRSPGILQWIAGAVIIVLGVMFGVFLVKKLKWI